MASPTSRNVHTPTTERSKKQPIRKPWTVDKPPTPAQNWNKGRQEQCVLAANKVLEDGGSDQEAVFACIRAAGKVEKLYKFDDNIATVEWFEKEHSGAMIAFYPPYDVAQRIAQKGGLKPEDIHLTLAYLGKYDEINRPGRLAHIIEQIAGNCAPLVGKVGGVGRFNTDNEDEVTPFYAVVDAPELPKFRQLLVETLGQAGYNTDNGHGYNPHLTLKYIKAGGNMPTRELPQIPLNFGMLTLKMGPTRLDFPMGVDLMTTSIMDGEEYSMYKIYKVNGQDVPLFDLAEVWLQKQQEKEDHQEQNEMLKNWSVDIFAKAEEKQIAYGVILRPNVTDADGDLYDAKEVEEAAHNYMAKTGGAADWLHHKDLAKDDAVLVESFIVPDDFMWGDFQVLKGDWLGGMWIPNGEMWEEVKKGNINAFSIKGVGKRHPL